MVSQKHAVQTIGGLYQWFMLPVCIIMCVVDKPGFECGSSDLNVLFTNKHLSSKIFFHWTVVQSRVLSSLVYPPHTCTYAHSCQHTYVQHAYILPTSIHTYIHVHTSNMHTYIQTSNMCTYIHTSNIHTYTHTYIHTHMNLDPRCCNPTLLNEGRIQPSRPSNVRWSVN